MVIDIMTAWLADPDLETDFVLQRLRANVLATGEEMELAIVRLLYGFVNLTGLLLIRRLREMGISEEETLRELALKFSGE